MPRSTEFRRDIIATGARPRVAIIGVRGYPSFYGGFETAVRALAPYLADHDWDVTVYSREEPGTEGDPRVHVVRTSGLESKSLSTLSYGFTASIDALGRHRPDVALVMNVANGFFLPLLNMRGVPTLVNVDGMEWEREKWGRLAKFMFKTGARMTGWWGTKLVYDSREIARRWKEDFGRDGVFIPYGGTLMSEPRVDVGWPHRSYVLFVARFVPENTVEEFFRAVPAIAKSHQVVIVGSSAYGGPLDKRAAELDTLPNVSWLGHVSNDDLLLSLWNQAGVYVHGHSVGGTNPALVQAMACGAPIVARDTPYNREVLGPEAQFFEPSAESIIGAVSSMLANPEVAEKSSHRNSQRAAESYSWDSICAGYETALTSLLRVWR